MRARSWLFVPGDSERKLAKIDGCGADVAVLDLEDAVAPGRKAQARELVTEVLRKPRGSNRPSLWVRVNPLSSDCIDADLDAVVPADPDGIVLPKPNDVTDVAELDRKLLILERSAGRLPREIPVVAIATETALGVANLAAYIDHPSRLIALAWGAEDLAAELGATGNRDVHGDFRPLFQHVRAQVRLAAAAAGLAALDTIHANYRDETGLAAYANRARADGFAGMLAIHPAQVAVINQAFTPTADEIAAAQRVVAAFEAGTGVVALDGRMLDRPHLAQARRIVEFAGDED